MRGAEALVRMLIEYDVKRIFGVPGAQTIPIYEAVYDHIDQISHCLFREETNAVFAADAYAKISNKPGVADATLGPGALRAIPAVAEAYNSSIPLILFMGNNPLSWLSTTVYRGNASQAVDQVRIFEPITKWSVQLTSVKSIPSVIRFAFRVATSGRPGPVAIDVPYDVLTEEAEFEDLYAQKEFSKVPAIRISPDPEKIAEAALLIQGSERPVIIVGGGVFLSDAVESVYRFATTFNLPVVTTINGKGAFPEIHPLSIGVLGDLGGWYIAEKIIKEADLLIFIGSNADQITTMNWSIPSKDQKVIHIDIDPVELCRNFLCQVPVVGDVKLSLEALSLYLTRINYKYKENWLENIFKYKREVSERLVYIPDEFEKESRINPKKVMKIIDDFVSYKKNILIVSDASSASGWVAGYLTVRDIGRRFLFPRGMAGLGYAIPGCIGSMLASYDLKLNYSKCIAVAGDGGAAYSIVEVETARRLKIPLIGIILNDASLGWIKKIQERSNKVYSSMFSEVNFAKIVEGLGGQGFEVERYEDLRESLEKCFEGELPCIIDVKVSTAVPYKPLYISYS
jgi:acetolactate synthase-1/2/3 large subunit